MVTETKLILEKLDEIKSELDSLKGRIVDVDVVLTEEDVESLNAAERDLARGKTKKL